VPVVRIGMYCYVSALFVTPNKVIMFENAGITHDLDVSFSF